MSVEKVQKQECPFCGGALRFDAVSGKQVCDYCGAKIEIQEPSAEGENPDAENQAGEENISGFDFAALGDQALREDAEDVPIYTCNSCGAELIAPPEQAALTCPYCGNNIVLTQKVSGKLRPDGLIPFKIDAKALPGAVQEFYKGKKLLPRRFFSENTMGKVQGVYVPFWVFGGEVSGNLSFSGEKRSIHQDGDYEITETRHFAMNRQVSMTFENVPVDASGRIDDALMDSMEPFHMENVVPFDMRYLAGYTADRFDVAKEEMTERARGRMFTTAEGVVRPKVEAGFSNVRRTGGNLNTKLNVKYLLFPVYMFSIKYGGQEYAFAVNGQTGKVSGNLPQDKGVSRKYFFIRFFGTAGAILGLFILKYMFGR
ncbi:MAG: hypothetical protein IJU50_04855 [Lachnospiraceae bacterium]|nr:hypothetical protein [Lachnospiraceae bacterium]